MTQEKEKIDPEVWLLERFERVDKEVLALLDSYVCKKCGALVYGMGESLAAHVQSHVMSIF